MPMDSRFYPQLSREVLERAAVRSIADDVQLGGLLHRRHCVEEMFQSLLFVETANKEKARAITRFPRLEEVSRHRHWGDGRMDTRNECFGFLLEPARNSGDRRGLPEYVAEERLRDSHGSRQSDIGSVQRRH